MKTKNTDLERRNRAERAGMGIYEAGGRLARQRGHESRTRYAGIGGLVGGIVGSFAGPVGAAVGAALGAGIGAAAGDAQDE